MESICIPAHLEYNTSRNGRKYVLKYGDICMDRKLSGILEGEEERGGEGSAKPPQQQERQLARPFQESERGRCCCRRPMAFVAGEGDRRRPGAQRPPTGRAGDWRTGCHSDAGQVCPDHKTEFSFSLRQPRGNSMCNARVPTGGNKICENLSLYSDSPSCPSISMVQVLCLSIWPPPLSKETNAKSAQKVIDDGHISFPGRAKRQPALAWSRCGMAGVREARRRKAEWRKAAAPLLLCTAVAECVLSLSLSESFGDDSFVGEKVNNLCRRRGREGEGGPANGEGIK